VAYCHLHYQKFSLYHLLLCLDFHSNPKKRQGSFAAHTAPLFRELKILRFTDIFLFQLGKFMYLFKLGLLPEIFNGFFSTNNQMHSYNTRKSNAFHIFPCRTNLRRFAIRFQGPKFFNSLPDNIKNAVSISHFKTKLKPFLLS